MPMEERTLYSNSISFLVEFYKSDINGEFDQKAKQTFRNLCSDEGLTLETSANLIFTAFNISNSTLHSTRACFSFSFFRTSRLIDSEWQPTVSLTNHVVTQFLTDIIRNPLGAILIHVKSLLAPDLLYLQIPFAGGWKWTLTLQNIENIFLRHSQLES